MIKSDRDIPVVFGSAAEFWEALPRDWPSLKYDSNFAAELDALFKSYASTAELPVRRILDCGSGTGNPSIGLALLGYDMTCVDSDPEMITKFEHNCAESRVRLSVSSADWRHLNGALQSGMFDAAICCGNSLIYAGCWERESFVSNVAAKAIEVSLGNIAKTLRPGGLFYVDITSEREYRDPNPKCDFVGIRETAEHHLLIYWKIDYDIRARVRQVHGHTIYESKATRRTEKVLSHEFTSYMLYHEELIEIAKRAGLTVHSRKHPMRSEWLYDVYLFRRE